MTSAAGGEGRLQRFFWPGSIAVVGASGTPGTLSGRPLRILLQHHYSGALYPVNPRYEELEGLRCYPSVEALPATPDLALVLVNAEAAPAVVDACARAGIANVVLISSGFGEQRVGGAEQRDRLRTVLARHPQLSLSGPNAEGFVNTWGPVPVGFSPTIDYDRGLERLLRGSVAVVAQSGGLGFALFNDGQARELGFSYVVSTGNEDGLSVLDYVDHLVDDPHVSVILLFVESLRNEGNRLADVARRAAGAGKPLVVAKVGVSPSGRRATASHTAHLAGYDEVYDAVFRRYGMIRAGDQEELVDYGMALSRGPLPRGERIGVLTYSGGTGAWVADALEAEGLRLPELSPGLQAQVEALIPAYGSARNPLDVTAQVIQTAGGIAPVLDLLASSGEVDAVVLVVTLSNAAVIAAERDRMVDIVARTHMPVVVYSYTRPSPEAASILAGMDLPWFTSGRRTARALRAMRDHRAHLDAAAADHDAGKHAAGDLDAGDLDAGDLDSAAAVRAASEPAPERLGAPGPWPEWQAKRVLRAAGLPVPAGELVADADAAVAAADRLGYPVVLKAQSPAIPHKTDAGAVSVGIPDGQALRAAVDAMAAHLSASAPGVELDGWLVERVCPPGTEVIVGLLRDPDLGPAVVVGFGGIHAEVLGDVVCVPAPLCVEEARHALGRLRGAALLDGPRGGRPADVAALAGIVCAVGDLAAAHPELTELDLNPVLVGAAGQGAWIADALGRLD